MARTAKLYNGMAYLAPNESYARESATMRPPVCLPKSICHDIRGAKWGETVMLATRKAQDAWERVQKDASNLAWLASREEVEQEAAA